MRSSRFFMMLTAAGCFGVCMVADGLGGPLKNNDDPRLREYRFYSGKHRVAVFLALDELSILTSEGDALARKLGLPSDAAQVHASLEPGRVILKLGAPSPTLAGIQEHAEALRSMGYAVEGVLRPGRTQSEDARQYLTRRLSVKLRTGHTLHEVLAAFDVDVVRKLTYSPDTYILEVRTGGLTAGLTVANALYDSGWAEFATPLIKRHRVPCAIPSDPLFGEQWHLRNTGQTDHGAAGNDINVVDAWDQVTGAGVNIAIVDDGLEVDHEDLQANVRTDIDFDINFNDADPSPDQPGDNHGTACAGMAAAEGNNGIGVSGSAPDAGLVGLRLIAAASSDADDADTFSHQADVTNPADWIHISSNSWGFDHTVADFGRTTPLAASALEYATTYGRGGRGTVFLFAAGNESCDDMLVTYGAYPSSRFTIAVAASGSNGLHSFYSCKGPAILVNAPSDSGPDCPDPGNPTVLWDRVTTTDRTGAAGYAVGDYCDDFGGTSAATPLVAGVVALMLEQNPYLMWRDVQHILVETAVQTDTAGGDWETNGAGRAYHNELGFGRVDALAAVNAAGTWINVPEQAAPIEASDSTGGEIPDGFGESLTRTLNVSAPAGFVIEHVEIDVSITHNHWDQLFVILTAPSGCESFLAGPRNSVEGTLFYDFTYTSVTHWGESAHGDWHLTLFNLLPGLGVGWLDDWALRFYGYEDDPPPQLTVSPDTHNVSFTSGSVASDGALIGAGVKEWHASVIQGGEWLTLTSPTDGTGSGTIEAAYSVNASATGRVGIIRVIAPWASGSPADITVIQAAQPPDPPMLVVDPEERNVAADAGETNFDVVNTGGGAMVWVAEVIEGDDWLTIDAGETGVDAGTIELSYPENTGSGARTATVRVTATDALGSPREVTVRQAGSDPMDINGDTERDAVDVQLVINAALSIDIAPYSGDCNNDGDVNAVDVQLVINAVLGLI
jgi:subtilisin family serine protease